MFKRLFTAAFVFGAAAMAPPGLAQAQTLCLPRDAMIAALAHDFNERLSGMGIVSETRVIELWQADGTGSFTVIVTYANGISCVLGSGEGWVDLTPVVAPGLTEEPTSLRR